MLPTEEEMSVEHISAMLQKYYSDNREEFEKALKEELTGGECYFRISKDGTVKLLTKQEYEALWQSSETSSE